jgi:hypothetical protein
MEYVYKYVSFKQSHKKTLENILENRIYFSKTTDDLNKSDCIGLTEQEINSNGIFSTSESYKNKHLWEKFGYGSSGICIEYDLNKILASTNNLNQKKVEYPIENDQISDNIFALPEKHKGEEEIRFVLSNITSEEERAVPLLENTMSRILLGVEFFSCHTFRSEKLDIFKQINPNTPIIHLTNFSCFNSYKTLTKDEVITKLNKILSKKNDDVTIPN